MGVADNVKNFRINIDPEFQGWILAFMTLNALWVYCLPCYCAGQSCAWARRLASQINKRLPYWLVFATFFNTGMLYAVILWLPDWDYKDYMKALTAGGLFLAKHIVKYMTSIVMIVAFCFVVSFKERIAKMLGLDHRTLFRFKLRDICNCGVHNTRAIEIYLWKAEDLPSAQMFSANNVYIETFLGYNEPQKSRVHNNAGSSCILKEVIQLNFDDTDQEECLYLFVKNQKVMGSSELGRLQELRPDQVKEWEAECLSKCQGKMPEWGNADHFKEVELIPRGRIWLHIRPLNDEDEFHSFGC